MTLKEVSYLNNVNDDTYKCVIFEYFFTNFYKIVIVDTHTGIIFGLFFNDTFKSAIFGLC